MNHTPEPWSFVPIDSFAGYGKVVDANGIELMINIPYGGSAPSNETMKRIVACVNACAGLPTKELAENGLVSAVGHELLNLDAQLATVTAQRDELLAALKIVTTGTVGDVLERLHEFHALVAKCEVQNG